MKRILLRILAWIGGLLVVILLALIGFLWFGNYHPSAVETAAVTCPSSAPRVEPGGTLKVLTWNVQTFSGKNYVFWSDLPDNDGPDEYPSPEDITWTLEEAARLIREEDPDILLLQELDNGADRTYYEDQFARLIELLPETYVCHSSVFDWKSAYVPHPRIHGSVGWMVAVLSKYQILEAERIQLTIAPGNLLEAQFKIKPALLKTILPIQTGGEFAALTVHLDLYVPGTDTKEIQLKEIDQVLMSLSESGIPWVLGGDFNLLPDDQAAYERLLAAHRKSYNPQSEIQYLFDRHQAVPSMAELTGADHASWFTRWPNDPAIPGPDRTLDYFFLSEDLKIMDHYVRMGDALKISDHLPVLVEFQLP